VVDLARILEVLGDEALAVRGERSRAVRAPTRIDDERAAGAIAFCGEHGENGARAISRSTASVVLCTPEVCERIGEREERTLVAVANPRRSFARVLRSLFDAPPPRGVHPSAVISPEAEVAADVYVGPLSFLARCRVGEGSVIHGHVHVYPGTTIGRNVTIHAGTVIGADGFGFERADDGRLERFPHLGDVVIEDDVEIGANACIDRGTLGSTVIGRGAKIDNLVYVAHNVHVGRDAVIIAQAAVCGSARVGERAWIAPGAAVRDKTSVGRDAVVGLGAAVVADVPAGTTVVGVPARPHERGG